MCSLFLKSFNPAKDNPDLKGKVVIVTGGNAGVGYAIVQHLARHGAKVYLAARNEEKARMAIERLHTQGLGPGNGEVIWLNLDLSNPRIVQKVANDFVLKEERLDILINNAALMLHPYQKSLDGIQDVVMVNYIGTCVFTRALLPIVKRTAALPGSDVRIVAVNSGANNQYPANVRFRNLDDLNRDLEETSFPQFLRYGFSKLMQFMFIKELQRRLDEQSVPILCIATDPGTVNTEGVQAYAHSVGPILSPIYTLIANLTFASPVKGAYSTVFAAAAPRPRERVDEYKGEFLKNPGVHARANPLAKKAALREELWETTERVLKDIGIELESV
ncbi:NAD-P-binding protein [Trametes punicea]|nr:NAD-P-binding protein [Trametes punicea]